MSIIDYGNTVTKCRCARCEKGWTAAEWLKERGDTVEFVTDDRLAYLVSSFIDVMLYLDLLESLGFQIPPPQVTYGRVGIFDEMEW